MKVIQAALADKNDTTRLILVVANATESDVLQLPGCLEQDFDGSVRLKIVNVLSRPQVATGVVGYVTSHLPEIALGIDRATACVLISGPPSFEMDVSRKVVEMSFARHFLL